MRILICGQRDLCVCATLNYLLPELGGHQVQILLADVPDLSTSVPDVAMLRFLDRDLPNRIIFPLLDRETSQSGAYMTFSRLALTYDAPTQVITEINDGIGLEYVKAFKPDLIYGVRFSFIFGEHVLRIARHGVLNTHPGALPKYAGHYGPFHAILAGDQQLGCTLFVPDKGIDTGPVAATRYLPVNPDRSVHWHMHQIYPLTIPDLLHFIDEIADGRRVNAAPQDLSLRRYYKIPTASEVELLKSRGRCLVDFEEYARLLIAPWLCEEAGLVDESGIIQSAAARKLLETRFGKSRGG